jgi:hypothetical protein
MKDNWIGVSMIDQVDCYSDIYNKTMFRDKEYNSRIIPILINNLVNPMKKLIATNSI